MVVDLINPIPTEGLHMLGVGTPTILTRIPLQGTKCHEGKGKHLLQYIMTVMVCVSILNLENTFIFNFEVWEFVNHQGCRFVPYRFSDKQRPDMVPDLGI